MVSRFVTFFAKRKKKEKEKVLLYLKIPCGIFTIIRCISDVLAFSGEMLVTNIFICLV